MKPISPAIGLFGAIALSNACSAQIFDDPFSQYFERSITITPGAGNAKDANAAIHTIDPWPPYAGYTRIPGDGRKGVNSIEQMYRVPNPFLSQQPGLGAGSGMPGAPTTGPGGGASNTGTGAAVGTPMQPISDGY